MAGLMSNKSKNPVSRRKTQFFDKLFFDRETGFFGDKHSFSR